MVFLLRAVLTSALFFVNVKTLKQRVAFIMHKKHALFSAPDILTILI